MSEAEIEDQDDGPDRFCYNCVHYHDDGPECRRHAPRPRFSADLLHESRALIIATGTDDRWNLAAWPMVGPRDWCGEFDGRIDEPSYGWMVEGRRHHVDKR